jgi:hypothetical protein
MSFTVGDFQDLLRLLDQHPEWRDELRQRLLTPELLQLPILVGRVAERLAALAEAQTRTEQRLEVLTARIDALAEAQTRTEQRLAELSEAQVRTDRQIETLANRMDALTARLDDLVGRMDELAKFQSRTTTELAALIDRVGTLGGRVLEWHYERHAPTFFGRLVRRARLVEPSRLADLLDDAVEQGRLTAAERDDLLLADLVVSGRRRADQADVFFVAEVSAGIGVEDVRRAVDRATILARLGVPVIPVVAGDRITSEAEEYARARGAWQLLDGRIVAPDQP